MLVTSEHLDACDAAGQIGYTTFGCHRLNGRTMPEIR